MPTPQLTTADARATGHTPGGLSVDLRTAVLQLARRIRQERGDQAITIAENSALAALARHGSMTPRRLADHEQISPPAMTRTLTNLAAKGYVTKTDDPSDGRQVLIELSQSGAALVNETRHRRSAWLSRRLAKLTPEERAVLAEAARIMAKVNSAQ
ncbi:MarR family winged helix-turn-helix transcriptional regulator [Rathayibacter soli]|uniref:MarR family winged helix-turn-helix transcriptional regulator n=1 Tax=Rathayibacter soli TaxID=3144168 RepID=UPI0027E497E4|nr:MarR family transcriptional regulator [Glaciibacter superstes]